MSLNRYAVRRDAVEPAIISALERVGAHVWQMDYPLDLLVYFRERFFLLEVKSDKGKLTPIQESFLATTAPGAAVVRTAIQALRAIGAVT